MIDAATGERQANIRAAAANVRLFVATWAEALPLLGMSPRVTGMGRRVCELDGCDGVLSAGFAGACRRDLRPGDVVPSAEIRTLDHIASPAEKAALGREGVAAADMETAWLAAAAAEAGLPFLGIRVVIDRVGDRALSAATAAHYLTAARALRRAVGDALRVGL
jgi:nucleoside phosphorylase